MQTLSFGKILYQKFGLYQGPGVGGENFENAELSVFSKISVSTSLSRGNHGWRFAARVQVSVSTSLSRGNHGWRFTARVQVDKLWSELR